MRGVDEGTLLASVVRYFDDNPASLEKFKLVLRGRVHGVSLRLLDYLVTNYSKVANVVFVAPDGERVRLFREYKAQLRGYSKLAFDPFARRSRIVVEFKDASMETTIAQLNFFRWAISRGVIDYASRHAAEIEAFYSSTRAESGVKGDGKLAEKSVESPQKSVERNETVEKPRQNVLSF